MVNTVFGTKHRMGQTFVEDTRVAVTVLKTGPSIVTQVKTEEKDGYNAVQLGYGEKSVKNVSKQLQGHLKIAIKEGKAPRYVREERLTEASDLVVGTLITPAEVLEPGDIVNITSISKGKGFAGVVKRYKFAGGPKTHGQSNRERSPGSIGQGTTPGRVWRGKKMAGRMGTETITVKNLHIVAVDPEKNEISIAGPVPGGRGTFVVVRKTGKGDINDLVKRLVTVKSKGKTGESEKEEGDK